MNMNCLICGVGGQGVILASRLIAAAALEIDEKVLTAETIGMAQRGGSVVSHVRVGAQAHSPLIPQGKADLIIALEPAEAVRAMNYLKPGGTVVVSCKAVKPATPAPVNLAYTGEEMLEYLRATVKNLYIVDTPTICTAAGSDRAANIALLGAAAASGALGFSLEQIETAIRAQTRAKYFESNKIALRLGAEAAASANSAEEAGRGAERGAKL